MSPRFLVRLLWLVLFAGTLCAEPTPRPSPSSPLETPPITISATFWNIQWFPGRRPNASRSEENRQIRAVHNDLAQLGPDIIGLEEVRDSKNASLAVEPLSNFKVDVCSNFLPREGQQEGQQIAIASRLQPISAWAEAWKRGGVITPPRGFAFAAYQLSPKQVLLVYAVHLKSNRGELHEDMRIREESMRQLISHIRAMKAIYGKMGTLTWLVGGDFNTSPDEPRFGREKTIPALLAEDFQWAWQGIPQAMRITMPSDLRYPPAAFDQIFYRGGTLSNAWVAYTSPKSSDHRAVNVVLKVK
ncbi:MAG TPA: endonuclease/exonuclease/phosphatase family protein [Chthoniobacterales bacterium]|nr:endonuclease/exonuclease/phosphatase family protein [Chthoniobacterales bacterium]